MHLGLCTLVLATLASRLVYAAAPNPHQLFALQRAAALAHAANSTSAPADHAGHSIQPRARDGMYKRHRRSRSSHGHGRGRDSVQDDELQRRGLEAGLERQRARKVRQSSTQLDKRGSGVWTGVSSYYLFALYDSDRHAVLDAIKSGGFSVVRIFVAAVGANNKGSNSRAVNDVEPDAVGVYDDTILGLIDQLMVDCQQRGLKLLIALSDRYALGFWATDCYATHLNIVQPGSSGAQKVADASSFYTDEWAISMFQKRLAHIMAHPNSLMGGKTWAELDSVILAVEPQNEPQGHMLMASSTWACDRAGYLKSLIKSNILISSGGGITTSDSLGSWAVNCDAIDIVSVHDYGTSAGTTAAALASARANHPDKQIIMGEWGIAGANKADLVAAFVSAFRDQGLSWMYWEVVRPGKAASDFEIWTDEPAWQALVGKPYLSASSLPASSAPAWSSAPTSSPAWAPSASAWSASPSAWSPSSPMWSSSSSAAWSSSSPAWAPSPSMTPSTTLAWVPSPSSTTAWSKDATSVAWTSASSAARTPASSAAWTTPSSDAASPRSSFAAASSSSSAWTPTSQAWHTTTMTWPTSMRASQSA
ncbi:hypothetical protein JCM3774_002357 [Rhodotorula dairenensis]